VSLCGIKVNVVSILTKNDWGSFGHVLGDELWWYVSSGWQNY